MIKVGIIGAGRIGRVHITSITTRVPDAMIKTVADPFLNDDRSVDCFFGYGISNLFGGVNSVRGD